MRIVIPVIDIHCHLLAGVDDGPSTIDESLALAQYAVQRGITHSVVTPHIHPGRWSNEALTIRASVDILRQALADKKIPLIIGMSGELRVGLDACKWWLIIRCLFWASGEATTLF